MRQNVKFGNYIYLLTDLQPQTQFCSHLDCTSLPKPEINEENNSLLDHKKKDIIIHYKSVWLEKLMSSRKCFFMLRIKWIIIKHTDTLWKLPLLPLSRNQWANERDNILYIRNPFKWSLILKSIRTNQHPASGLKDRTELITLNGHTYYNTVKNYTLYDRQKLNSSSI